MNRIPFSQLAKLPHIPWWFRFIGWLIPTEQACDEAREYRTIVYYKRFRGKMYLIKAEHEPLEEK